MRDDNDKNSIILCMIHWMTDELSIWIKGARFMCRSYLLYKFDEFNYFCCPVPICQYKIK